MLDVIVIGAGVAGMAAARECAEAGLTVRVLEAQNRAGGRLYAEDVPGGGSLELGGQFFHLDATPLLAAEITRYGVATKAPLSCHQQLVFHDGEIHDLAAVFAAHPEQRRSLVTTVRELAHRIVQPGQREALESVSVTEGLGWFELHPVIHTWFRSWIEQYAGTGLDHISVANMVGLVEAARGSLRSASHVSGEWLAPDTRGFTEALREDISELIYFDQPVRRVSTLAEGGFRVGTDTDAIRAKTVIFALPRNVLAANDVALELDWDAEVPTAIREPQPGLGQKAWVRLDKNAPASTEILGNLGGFRLLGIGEREADGSVWAVLFGNMATFGADSVDLEAEVRRTIEDLWDGAVGTLEVRAHDWVADPFARSAWTVAPVQRVNPIPELHAALPDGIAFAGADFSVRRGGVESALQSGSEAAARVRSHLLTNGGTDE